MNVFNRFLIWKCKFGKEQSENCNTCFGISYLKNLIYLAEHFLNVAVFFRKKFLLWTKSILQITSAWVKCEIRNVHGKKSKWHLILYGWFVSSSGMVVESATVCVCDRFKLFVNYRAFCFGLRSGRLLFYSPSCAIFRNIRWRSTHTHENVIFLIRTI